MAPTDTSIPNGVIDLLSQWFGEHSWLGDVYFQVIWLIGTLVILKFAGRCQPSRQCFILLFLPILIYSLGLVGANMVWLSWVFNPLLCCFLLLDRFVLSISPTQLTSARAHHARFSIRNKNQVHLSIQNESAHSVSGELMDQYPDGFQAEPALGKLSFQLKPYETVSLEYHLTPHRRGPYHFGQTYCRYKSPLGLLWIRTTLGAASPVDVYPDMRQIKKLRLLFSKAHALGELQKRRLGSEGTQFDSLRNYFAGDDVRKIAWQATARMDAPVIRVYTHEVEQPIVILVDAGRKMMSGVNLPEQNHSDAASSNPKEPRLSKFDYALNAALAFASVALDRGDDVAMRVFHQDTIAEIPLSRGQKQFQKILSTVAHVQAEAIEPDYESTLLETARSLTKRSLIVLFTDLIDPLTSKTLVHSLGTLAKQHVILVATWQDEWLTQSIKTIPTDIDTIYQQGVRLDLLDLRRRTLQALAHHGNISIVDATPDTLNERVIHHYVSMKLKNKV